MQATLWVLFDKILVIPAVQNHVLRGSKDEFHDSFFLPSSSLFQHVVETEDSSGLNDKLCELLVQCQMWNENLRYLDLRGNLIDSKGLGHLCRFLSHSTSLTFLNLGEEKKPFFVHHFEKKKFWQPFVFKQVQIRSMRKDVSIWQNFWKRIHSCKNCILVLSFHSFLFFKL